MDEYGHKNPTYARPIERLRAVKHRFPQGTCFWGENALRYTLSRDPSHDAAWHVFYQYHHSPEHDKEMLSPVVTRFGTASVLDAEGHLYNVEVFAN